MPELNPAQFHERSVWIMQNTKLLGEPEDQQRIVSHLAASRVPLPHEGLRGSTLWATKYGMQPDHAGEYSHGQRLVRIHPEVIEHPQGLLHEVGHLDSAHRGLHHAAYDTPQRQAAEESYAEVFALRHRR